MNHDDYFRICQMTAKSVSIYNKSNGVNIAKLLHQLVTQESCFDKLFSLFFSHAGSLFLWRPEAFCPSLHS